MYMYIYIYISSAHFFNTKFLRYDYLNVHLIADFESILHESNNSVIIYDNNF